jgi:hypothetical protein
MLAKTISRALRPCTSYIEIHGSQLGYRDQNVCRRHRVRRYTAFRRGVAIAAVHARFNLTNKGEKNAGRYTKGTITF